MEVQTLPDGSKHYIFGPDEHAVMTGPVTGIVTLDDGTAVNVSDPYVAVDSPEKAAELAHQIAMIHVENGHPNDVDMLTDPETGAKVPVQRPFVYQDPTSGDVHVGVGTVHGDHPLDEANGITAGYADPRIAAADADPNINVLRASQPVAASTPQEG